MSGPEDDARASTLVTPEPKDAGEAAADVAELTEGAKLGRYRLVERLGAGAMGVVWSAEDPHLDRRVAIKVVHSKLARTAEASNRLKREARAMAKLSHRGVVIVHDVGEAEGRLFIAMELVPGTSLGQMLRGRNAEQLAEWRKWLGIMLEAGRGLAAAHREGVLHRDFKPDNVLVERSGRVCVADFGLATLGETVATQRAPRDSTPLDLTTTGTLIGTPAYMSPQQLRGEPIDARSDQFSFCVATWEALYGRRPYFAAESGPVPLASLLKAIETSSPKPPDVVIPSAIRDVLVRGLSSSPNARWPTMDALLTALERGVSEATSRASRRRMWIVVAALAAVAIAIALYGIKRSAEDARPDPKRLFGVALRTRIAVSDDGKRIALAGRALEVRETQGAGYWPARTSGDLNVVSIEFDGDLVLFGEGITGTRSEWRYKTDPGPTTQPIGAGWWHGRTSRGDLIYNYDAHVLRLVSGDREAARWPVESLETVHVSPDRARFAYIDGKRFAERLVVRDVAGNGSFEQLLPGLTAIAWRDNSHLLYAVGATTKPFIQEIAVWNQRPGPPRTVFELDAGWFSDLAVVGDQLFYIEMGLSSRARLIDRKTLSARDFDVASVAAPLAWMGADQFLIWNRSAQRVVRRTAFGVLETSSIVLDSEPANATVAGDVLIVTLRRNAGRFAIAYSMSKARALWQHDDLHTLAVRCAGDVASPCFALRNEDGHDRIARIDAVTGQLGPPIYEGEKIEDFAVALDGSRVAIAFNAKPAIVEVDAKGGVVRSIATSLGTTRSIAYDPTGGWLVAGTLPENHYATGRLDETGAFTPYVQTEDDILSLIRPSPDGHQVLLLSRLYSPALWQVKLPR